MLFQKNKSKMHGPVLVQEVLEALHVKNSARYIDATIGTGGHAIEILKAGGIVLGIDADNEMLEIAKERLGGAIKLIYGNFKDIDKIARKENFYPVDGIVFDLGISSVHYGSGRGFSFENWEEILDMRLNPTRQNLRASDLLNLLRKDQLIDLFGHVLDRKHATIIATRVIKARRQKKIEKVGDFLDLLDDFTVKKNLHKGTLPFLALRMAVNSELENLKEALVKAFSILKIGGVLLVISFHSGEDRVVKRVFKNLEKKGVGFVNPKKPIVPKELEIIRNPSSRSAKLRVITKL